MIACKQDLNYEADTMSRLDILGASQEGGTYGGVVWEEFAHWKLPNGFYEFPFLLPFERHQEFQYMEPLL